MYFSPALVAAFAGLVYGANTAATTQTVLVAQNNGLTFTPNTVTAAAGSQVAFQFTNGNHTVTAGTLGQACAPGGAGFASGFVPVNNNPTNPPTIQGTLQGNAFVNNGQLNQGNQGNKNNKRSDFQVRGMNGIWGRAANGNPTFTVTVANTQPQPVYCNQQLHCQQGPMVMIINGNAQQLAQYQASAQQAKQNVIANGPTGGTLTGNVQQTTTTNNNNNGNQQAQQAQQAQQQAQQQQAQQAAQQAQQAQQQAQQQQAQAQATQAQQAAQQQQQQAQQQQQQQAEQQAQEAAQQAKNNN